MRTIPETANRQDWARLVAQSANTTKKQVDTLVSNTVSRAKLRFIS